MSQKSYDNSPTLYVVPTPIGNLGDITYRTIEVLNSVDVIFSEDTRVTRVLLNHFEIKKSLIASHKFNEDISSRKILDYLKNGKSVAIVSDRGTPIVSDPGFTCTSLAIKEGYNVVSLPGATALIPALTSSGLDASRFVFYGFLNSKSSARIKELELLKDNKMTIIFYEAPHRILDTLKDILNVFGNRYISISREISKKHEEIYRGDIESVINEIGEPKGEYVIVVSGDTSNTDYSSMTIEEHVKMYMEDGLSEKDAIKKVAKDRKVAKSDIYKKIVLKKK